MHRKRQNDPVPSSQLLRPRARVARISHGSILLPTYKYKNGAKTLFSYDWLDVRLLALLVTLARSEILRLDGSPA